MWMRLTHKSGAQTADEKPLSAAIALVTGGSRGIGRAIATRLASLGAAVAVCGRDANALNDVGAELAGLGGRVFSHVADVTRAADVAALVAKTESALGSITILVNNTGIGVLGSAHEKSEEDWDRVLNTNLKSVFLVSRSEE